MVMIMGALSESLAVPRAVNGTGHPSWGVSESLAVLGSEGDSLVDHADAHAAGTPTSPAWHSSPVHW